MRNFSFKFLMVFCLLFVSVNDYAQNPKLPSKPVMHLDSSKVTPVKFNKEALETYAEQKEFHYDSAVEKDLSLWDRFWIWFWRMINDLFRGAASNPLSKYIFIALGVAILLYIIIKIIGSENIFSRKPKETIPPYDILNENIHQINYETEIQKLIDEKKYRLAIRLLYLKTLKELSDAGIIQWQPQKTNYTYLTEIALPEMKNEFGLLTYQFDHIWYGDFPVDAQRFEPINQSFNHFNTRINEGV